MFEIPGQHATQVSHIISDLEWMLQGPRSKMQWTTTSKSDGGPLILPLLLPLLLEGVEPAMRGVAMRTKVAPIVERQGAARSTVMAALVRERRGLAVPGVPVIPGRSCHSDSWPFLPKASAPSPSTRRNPCTEPSCGAAP